MSGAEAAIAGIGFLCNAMQIVTFGRDILQVYSHIRNERCPDQRLEAYLKSAKACFDDINSSALATSQAVQSNRDQQQIIEIGKKLEDSMTQLQSKFAQLHVDDASRRGFRAKYHWDIAKCIKESLSERDDQVRKQGWSALLQKINTGLEWIGKDNAGYCIQEVNKRGLQLIHPWVNAVIVN
ncbi:hypothetical protein BFJ63_vAg13725 [Fusarium oxysporum f. sp. narcissi]|uniref:Uncharacterized protein n=1 Tax=Fusarium oxysporum f. sp. narcissi TaxID=451672 RepID=A0A4Q2V875_FUSOX|nr:hypothetical protein BFJ63_vAg13725 [Fusarium oxysporum f. sp. narcissi]